MEVFVSKVAQNRHQIFQTNNTLKIVTTGALAQLPIVSVMIMQSHLSHIATTKCPNTFYEFVSAVVSRMVQCLLLDEELSPLTCHFLSNHTIQLAKAGWLLYTESALVSFFCTAYFYFFLCLRSLSWYIVLSSRTLPSESTDIPEYTTSHCCAINTSGGNSSRSAINTYKAHEQGHAISAFFPLPILVSHAFAELKNRTLRDNETFR